MRVLITGTTGWLGGSLAEALAKAGHTVVGASRRVTSIEGVESVQVDIGDAAGLAACFAAQESFDVVVHMAGALGACDMQTAFDVNVTGTRLVLDAARAAKAGRVVVASSVAAIGTGAPGFAPKLVPAPVDHVNVLGPWPYAWSKSAVEDVCRVICAMDKDLEVLAVRVGNVVTDPPRIVHHDGKGVEYPVLPATSADAANAIAEKGYATFPEAPLCSIALSDMVACLVASTLAPKKVGYRALAAVGPTSFSDEPVGDVMRAWYGADAPDCAHFDRPGHERDAFYDLEPAFKEVGWRPVVDLNQGSVLKSNGLVYLVIEKHVPHASTMKWLRLASELAAETRKEQGCVFYDFVRVSPTDVRIVECWAGAAQLAAHAASAHFTRLVPEMDAISETKSFTQGVDALPAVAPLAAATGARDPDAAVFLVIKKSVVAASQARWLEMAKDLAAASRQEAGCLFYDFVRVGTDATDFRIVECWASEAHLAAHAASPHFVMLIPLMDAISGTPEFQKGSDALAPFTGRTSAQENTGKILVMYDSSTSCTALMAQLVAEGARQLDRTEVRIRRVGGVANHWDQERKAAVANVEECTMEDLLWCDGVAVGSPCNLGGISWRMKKFWDDFSQSWWSKVDGKIGCAFVSQGGHAGGAELVCQAMNNVILNFGFSVFGTTDYVTSINTQHYGACCAKAPRNAVDQMACRRLGLRLAEFVGLYIKHRPETHPLLSSKRRDLERWGGPHPPRDADIDELVAINGAPLNFGSAGDPRPTALIFTKMAAYQHNSTPASANCAAVAAEQRGYRAIVSSDSALLEDPAQRFDVIVLVNCSGEAFDLAKEQLSAHVARGGGVLGIHAALASFLDGADAVGGTKLGATTTLISDVFGAHFLNHPLPQDGSVVLDHAALRTAFGGDLALSPAACLPGVVQTRDEFFNFNHAPPADCVVLARLDETTYEGGLMGADHPIVWCRELPSKARVFYTGLGHFDASYHSDRGDGGLARKILQTGFNFVAKDPCALAPFC
ncbi:hypothetical protein M885DRAFT_613334 [Pelagophyceae sp. CCMP2097]|nr:hypothetical protein M885DRAFT_613334 [Pelagophyceae sp. CCMP2097]